MRKCLLMVIIGLLSISCTKTDKEIIERNDVPLLAQNEKNNNFANIEEELVKRIKYLNDPTDARSKVKYEPEIGIKNIEETIWWDSSRLNGFSYNKRILFYYNYFIVHDMNDGLIASGTYTVQNDNIIECKIVNRYYIQRDDLFEEYYKLFFNNEIIRFEFKYDGQLYYNQLQLISDPGNEMYTASRSNAQKDEAYYYLDNNIKVYKYNGGIKRTTSRLNVRKAPSVDSEIIKVLEKNGIVEINARTEKMEEKDGINEYWYYVNYAISDQYIAAYGFIFGGYLIDN